jgi:hypothetical protein
LLLVHHPDRGGDPAKAAEINAIYERMLKWLDGNGSRWRDVQLTDTPIGGNPKIISRLRANTGKFGALALAAAATYAAFRRGSKR